MTHAYIATGDLLAAHSSRIALIRQYANEAHPDDFDSKWLGVLERCAAWFSSMPLRPDQHAEPGGALRATIEAVYFAMRLSGAQKFAADQTSERRRTLEPQYLYALFLSAACSRLDEPCRHFQFVRDSDGAEWIPAIHGAFGAWLGQANYQVRLRETSLAVERMRTALLAREILGTDHLSQFEPQVLSDLFGSINPDPNPPGLESLLQKVVRQAIDTTTTFEVKARRAAFVPDATPAPSVAALTAAAEAARPATGIETSRAKRAAPNDGLNDREAGAALVADLPRPAPTQETWVTKPNPTAMQLDGNKPLRPQAAADPFKDVLAGTSSLMREFFRALSQDAAAGKVRVSRVEGKVAISKRILGNYGIGSDTLIDNLRRFQLLYKTVGQEILLVDRVGSLVAAPDDEQSQGEAQ